MTLSALIAEARAVREYLLTSSSGDLARELARASAIKRADRLIATLERLTASIYASGIETALRVECGDAQLIVAVMEAADLEAR